MPTLLSNENISRLLLMVDLDYDHRPYTLPSSVNTTALLHSPPSKNISNVVVLDMQWTPSEQLEILYQTLFFLIGTPLNAIALFKYSRSSCDINNNNKMRLIRLSRQLLLTHLMLLGIHCLWRSFWLYNISWIGGNLLCKVYSFLSALPFHLWSNIVCAIALDMCYCILSPLKSVHNGSRRVTWMISIAWGSAIFCSAPMLLFKGTMHVYLGNDLQHEGEQCFSLLDDFTPTTLMLFDVLHTLTIFYIPLSIIICSYVLIGLSLRTQIAERKVLSSTPSNATTSGGGKLHDGAQRQKTPHQRTFHQRTTIRFIIATVCIVATFIITWAPYQIFDLLQLLCNDEKCDDILARYQWLEAILISSTIINPFLYKFGLFQSQPRRRRQSRTPNGGRSAGYTGLTSTHIALNHTPSRVSMRSAAGLSALVI